MTRVLVYLDNPPASDVRLVERVLCARRAADRISPLCSSVLESPDSVAAVRSELATVRFPGSLCIVETPLRSDEGCDQQEALRAAMAHEEAKRFLAEGPRDGQRPIWTATALPWCWAVSVRFEEGIPPGIGFLVDRTTRQVMPHRWIDVMAAVEEATRSVESK